MIFEKTNTWKSEFSRQIFDIRFIGVNLLSKTEGTIQKTNKFIAALKENEKKNNGPSFSRQESLCLEISRNSQARA